MRLEEANLMVRGSSLVSRVLGLAMDGELIKINISDSSIKGDVITGPGDACPYNWILLPSNRACEHDRAVITTRFQSGFSNRALVHTVPLGSTVDQTSRTSKPELDAMDLRPSG